MLRTAVEQLSSTQQNVWLPIQPSRRLHGATAPPLDYGQLLFLVILDRGCAQHGHQVGKKL